MLTLIDLANEFKGMNKKFLGTDGSEAAIKVAINVLNNLGDNTPVLTGKALSNWQVGLGRPDRSEIEPHSTVATSDRGQQNKEVMILTAHWVLSEKKPGQTIFISNNVPYIGKLNEGSSKQQPIPGFVERAVAYGEYTFTYDLLFGDT